MNSPGSSSSNSSIVSVNSPKWCQVCGQQAHGKHFGAVTCRACAAFFRRCGAKNNVKPCTRGNNCQFLKNGWFNCKKCRLQKCKDVGMTVENFQFDRDSFCPRKSTTIIPETFGTFLGRPNLILFVAPKIEMGPKSYIDMKYLVNKAHDLLIKGPETPIFAANSLEKLALGLRLIRGTARRETKVITKIGKEETLALWQEDILKVARWLTYFDEFQKLPHILKSDILKGIWKVWSRLENLAITAIGRRLKICHEQMLMAYVEKDQVICDVNSVVVDLTWCSNYTLEQLKFFEDRGLENRMEDLVQAMMTLQPTDVELSFMMCQLCFYYVGKRYQGEMLEVAERLQDRISDDLHDYYVNRMNMPQYSMRLASMMKINNHIQQDIYRGRVKSELAHIFDVFTIEFSHPDMFLDI